MPNVVQATIEKALPANDVAPRKASAKSKDSFDAELKKARPKSAPTETKPAPKKEERAAKAKAKDVKPQAKHADAPETEEVAEPTDEQSAEVKQEPQMKDPKTAKLPDVPKATPAKKADPNAVETNDQHPKDTALVQTASPQIVPPVNRDTNQDQSESQNPEQQQAQKVQPDQVQPAQLQVQQPQKEVSVEKADVKAKPTNDASDATAVKTVAHAEQTPQPKAVQPKAAKASKAPVDAKQVQKVTEDDETVVTDDADAEDEPAPDGQPVAKQVKKAVAAPAPTSGQQPTKAQPTEAQAAPQPDQPPEALAIQAKKSDENVSPQPITDHPDEPAAAAPVDDAPPPVSHADLAQAVAADLQPKAPAAAPAAPLAHPVAPEPPAPPVPPEIRFADTNHPQIVTGMRGQLLPDGGTMHIRLDPPELGALQVSVHMENGVMTASFQTSNDEATKLLSHSLAQLKHVLESQGVSVDKLHVTQTPRDQQSDNDNPRQQPGSDNPSARQEQQRREILQRMWRKLTNGSDPLDTVA